ncbi:Uncharacterised protein [Vibrio cholerae]|nr:Uncharacterised protein [Vibrio cholerae]
MTKQNPSSYRIMKHKPLRQVSTQRSRSQQKRRMKQGLAMLPPLKQS